MSYFAGYFWDQQGGASATQFAADDDSIFAEVFAAVLNAFPEGGNVGVWDTIADPANQDEDAIILEQTDEDVLQGDDWLNVERIYLRVTGASAQADRAEELCRQAILAIRRFETVNVTSEGGLSKDFAEDIGTHGMFLAINELEVR